MLGTMEVRLARLRARATDELESLRQRPGRAVLVGLGLVVLALLGRLAVGDRIGLPYVTMFPAIVISAYIGGWRLGLAATALCALAAAWLFMPYNLKIGELRPIDIAGLAAFLVTATLLVFVGDFAAHASLESLRLARQRQTLLSELQHRIKNHLQLMGAMLAFHARAASNERIKARLEEAGRRLQVIAQSYDNLYEPGALIDMREHLRRLCDFVEKGLANEARISLEAADVRWSLDTVIPLSLIANELLTNAVKHLPEGRTLDVEVRLERAGERMRLSVASNASALPEDFEVEGSGLGLRLAGVLAKQLGGSLSVPQPPRALFIVDFPEPRAA
jgi:two-component sensor histidine kinase